MSTYIDPLRDLSAFDYLMNYREQGTLIKHGKNDYIHNVHDSLHFSNGKWFWFSRGFGGISALDYLEKVEGYPKDEARKEIANAMRLSPSMKFYQNEVRKPFILPQKDKNNNMIINYLTKKRHIDLDIVNYFIENNMLYQDKNFKNAVFVGYKGSTPAYAFKRSIFDSQRFDHAGSNKAYSFNLTNTSSNTLHVFEACIDLLSYLTILKLNDKSWLDQSYLSLAGAAVQLSKKNEPDLPIALRSYLERHPNINHIVLHLDNDEVGIKASEQIIKVLPIKYTYKIDSPKQYKDINEMLIGEYYG